LRCAGEIILGPQRTLPWVVGRSLSSAKPPHGDVPDGAPI
jgi:hypothetical protein